ncbi:MAG: uracil-DNA glycosylase, partial [Patescibacteria group bacterium]
SFSVPEGSKAQPSLQNIFKELKADLGVERTKTDLTDWAEQGVLLLNSVLTVRNGQPASHRGKGWETFTDAAIKALSDGRERLVFVLWGNFAIGKLPLIDTSKHVVIKSPHPSPFSAHSGFFGSKPFSKANAALANWNEKEIQW